MISRSVISVGLLAFILIGLASADEIATLRKGTPIDEQGTPAPIPKVVNSDLKQKRNYPMQPPLIPHTVRGYEVNLKVNRCMACHARRRTEESQAPMISVTHYMDRAGNFLAEISPRRYFCNQCHVTQTDARDTPENDFQDMDEILQELSRQESD